MDGFGEEAIVVALVQPRMKGGVERGVDKTSERKRTENTRRRSF